MIEFGKIDTDAEVGPHWGYWRSSTVWGMHTHHYLDLGWFYVCVWGV